MKILEIQDIKTIIDTLGHKKFNEMLVETLENDYSNWSSFDKMPRVANHVDGGVIELMPISDNDLYTFKYVNGHPGNPKHNDFTVMATGQLSKVSSGEPLLFTEMTLLTALRTAANSAMAAKYLAKKDSKILTLIGTGSQSEFQYLSFSYAFNLEEVRFFDIDPDAMNKFAKNMESRDVKLTPCKNTEEAIQGADIITTCTADKKYQTILTKEMIKDEVYINAIGGDCPGKTELEKELVESSIVVCEYLEQCKIEGEIQQLDKEYTCTEFYEIILGKKSINVDTHGTVVFDSVGFAIEDYSTLKLIHKLANELNIGKDMYMIPKLNDVKNLYSLLDDIKS